MQRSWNRPLQVFKRVALVFGECEHALLLSPHKVEVIADVCEWAGKSTQSKQMLVNAAGFLLFFCSTGHHIRAGISNSLFDCNRLAIFYYILISNDTLIKSHRYSTEGIFATLASSASFILSITVFCLLPWNHEYHSPCYSLHCHNQFIYCKFLEYMFWFKHNE